LSRSNHCLCEIAAVRERVLVDYCLQYKMWSNDNQLHTDLQVNALVNALVRYKTLAMQLQDYLLITAGELYSIQA